MFLYAEKSRFISMSDIEIYLTVLVHNRNKAFYKNVEFITNQLWSKGTLSGTNYFLHVLKIRIKILEVAYENF